MATIVDSYSETNENSYELLDETHPSAGLERSAVGQAFEGDGSNIESCKFYLRKDGTPGSMIARLYAHTGTYGVNGKPTGAALDSSTEYATTSVGANYALFEFTGFSGYTLVDGTKYCIVVETTSGTWDASNDVDVAKDTSGEHAGNGVVYILSSWSSYIGDTIFYVYGVLPVVAPTVTTQAATDVDTTSCTGKGTITATGGENCHTRGFCYMEGTSGDPTTANSKVFDNGAGSYGTGAYDKAITGLTPGTGYRVRAYAINSAGTGYGATVQVTTIAGAPRHGFVLFQNPGIV